MLTSLYSCAIFLSPISPLFSYLNPSLLRQQPQYVSPREIDFSSPQRFVGAFPKGLDQAILVFASSRVVESRDVERSAGYSQTYIMDLSYNFEGKLFTYATTQANALSQSVHGICIVAD